MLQYPIHERLWAPSKGGSLCSALLSFCLLFLTLSACSTAGTGGSTPTPTPVPFIVTSVDLSVTPTSIAGKTCGSLASFTYRLCVKEGGP